MSKGKSLLPCKPLSGFQDLLPHEALAFHDAIDKITAVYRRFGFVPIDTPCIFSMESLAGETGEIDNQLYRWQQGKREVALRFDLTVPLARYVAANVNTLNFPFKRYHMGKVWRGERPQKGRYREFTQLDFDIVGTDSPLADLECLLVISEAIEALGLTDFCIRLNDRALLTGVMEGLGLADKAEDVLRSVDKLDKIGVEKVKAELMDACKAGLSADVADSVLAFINFDRSLSNAELWAHLDQSLPKNDKVELGLKRLKLLLDGAARVLPEGRLKLDPSIARGLGYYTGPVFETVLNEFPQYGSVCSGGRYDDLASRYTKRELPGVGASVGLSRLLAAVAEKAKDEAKALSIPTIILPLPGVDPIEGAVLRKALHDQGLAAELYPQSPSDWAKPSKTKAMLRYASEKNFRLAVIIGAAELENGTVQLKDLNAHEQAEVAQADLAQAIRDKIQ